MILIIFMLLGNFLMAQEYHFDFGNGKSANSNIQITDTTFYSEQLGYGIQIPGNSKKLKSVSFKEKFNSTNVIHDYLTSGKPFYFVMDLPEGDYEVNVLLGGWDTGSITSVKAESRRLFVLNKQIEKGNFQSVVFNVNVRTPTIDNNQSIKLKSREINYLNWDNKLHLEFNGPDICVSALEIKKINTDKTTVYLTGNSTVVDQEVEPWASWGQMITYFFDTSVVVANYAESGEALKSFVAENRLKKVLSTIQPGDYMFIEFGHNDQKPQSAAYLEANSGFKQYLKMFIDSARKHGAHPVLVTSTQRRNFNDQGKIINTHGDYPQTVREVGKAENVPVIDLTRMSTELYEALGVEGSKNAFVHYPAGTFPGQKKPLADNSHFNNYGAFQLAKCIVEGIKSNVPELTPHLKNNISDYEPARPDDVKSFNFPESPKYELVKPDGN